MKKGSALLILLIAVMALTAYSEIGWSKGGTLSETSNYFYCELVQQDRYIGSSSQETTNFMNYGKASTYQNRFDESSNVRKQKRWP